MKALSYRLIYHSIVCTFLSMCFLGCTEIFEEDIQNENISLISPGDSVRIESNTITFRWLLNNKISLYRLELVSPNFKAPTQFIFDTLTQLNSLTLNLNPGQYEWRIRGENGGYQTAYTSRVLFVDTALDLSGSMVQLLSPVDSLQSNQSNHLFRWKKIVGATSYTFQLLANGFQWDTTLVNDQINRSLTQENWYTWEVKANNAQSETPFVSRQIRYNITPPLPPILATPVDGFTVNSDSITLKWTKPQHAIQYRVFLYSASGTNLIPGYPIIRNDTLYAFPISSGQYFWEVTARDISGNESGPSAKRQFTIN